MKTLKEILNNIKNECNFDLNLEINSISINSKNIEEKDLYVAIKGENVDGNNYIKEGIKNGAIAVVTDDNEAFLKNQKENIKIIKVDDIREAYGYMSCNYFDNPVDGMRFIGISGTNGKTTIAHMIYNILNYNGIKAGLSGTIGNIVNKEIEETSLTTLDSFDFFKLLKRMKDNGCEVVVSEVSAHAIFYKKIVPVIADIAVFSNCSLDHLDFFKNMEKYRDVKKSYFNKKHAKTVIINSDDKTGVQIINSSDAKVISYGIKNPSDIFAINIKTSINGTSFVANIFDEIIEIKMPISGIFNVYNALAAATVARLLNVSINDIKESFIKMPEIPGRFNRIKAKNCDFIIDYAHTPDGLKKILSSARRITNGKLICVFGCGGDRDKIKRPVMGEISAAYSDYTIITSDNPRFEDPIDIIKEVEAGVKEITTDYRIIVDREDAIATAYECAEAGDVIVVAGKGCENYLDIKGEKRKYNDRDTILKVIS